MYGLIFFAMLFDADYGALVKSTDIASGERAPWSS